MIRGFRLFFEDSKPKEIPEWFYFCPKLTDEVLGPSKDTPSGAVATLNGLEGISSSVVIFKSFFDFNGVGIQMPGEETLKLNNLSKVKYQNPDYLSGFGFRAGRRIQSGASDRTSKRESLSRILSQFLSELRNKYQDEFDSQNHYDPHIASLTGDPVGASDLADFISQYNPHKPGFLWYKKPSKRIKKINKVKSAFNFKNLDELSERILKFIKIFNINLYKKTNKKEVVSILKPIVLSNYGNNETEEEWVTKRQPTKANVEIGGEKSTITMPVNKLHIPEGSIIYLSSMAFSNLRRKFFPKDSEITNEEAQKIILDKLKNLYHVHVVENADDVTAKAQMVKTPELSEEEDNVKTKLFNILKSHPEISIDNFYRFVIKNKIEKPTATKFLKLWQNHEFISIKNNQIQLLVKDFIHSNNKIAEIYNYIKNNTNTLGAKRNEIIKYLKIDKKELESSLRELKEKNKIIEKQNGLFLKKEKDENLTEKEEFVLSYADKGLLKDRISKKEIQEKITIEEYLKILRKLYVKDLLVYVFRGNIFYSTDSETKITKAMEDFLHYVNKHKIVSASEIDYFFKDKNLIANSMSDVVIPLIRKGYLKNTEKSRFFVDKKYSKSFTQYEKKIIKILSENHYIPDLQYLVKLIFGEEYNDMLYDVYYYAFDYLVSKEIINHITKGYGDGYRVVLKNQLNTKASETIEGQKILSLLEDKPAASLDEIQKSLSMPRQIVSYLISAMMNEKENKITTTQHPVSQNINYYLKTKGVPKFDLEEHEKLIINVLNDKPKNVDEIWDLLQDFSQESENIFSSMSIYSLGKFLNYMASEGKVKKQTIYDNEFYSLKSAPDTIEEEIERDIINTLEKLKVADFNKLKNEVVKLYGLNPRIINIALSRMEAKKKILLTKSGNYYLPGNIGINEDLIKKITNTIQRNGGQINYDVLDKFFSPEEISIIEQLEDFGIVKIIQRNIFYNPPKKTVSLKEYNYLNNPEGIRFIIKILKSQGPTDIHVLMDQFKQHFNYYAFHDFMDLLKRKMIVKSKYIPAQNNTFYYLPYQEAQLKQKETKSV